MSPIERVKRWTHQVHMPVIHLPHALLIRWMHWHISTQGYWIIGLVVGLLALYVLLVIFAYSRGSRPDIEPSQYFWP